MTLTPDQRRAFIALLAPAAQASAAKYGVPASVTLAQAILESGWGQTRLAIEDNNYFGIKQHGVTEYAEFPTTEYINGVSKVVNANFAKYPTAADAFADHAALLTELARYAPAMAVKGDPQQFAAQLGPCGYSTNPGYGALLWTLITEYDLTQYDNDDPGPAAIQDAST